MDPTSALPSYRVYRGSLIALLIGSVFAVWLLVRPGGEADQAGPSSALAAVLPSGTPTRAATQAPVVVPSGTPIGSATPGGSPTPAPSATATTAPATPSPTAAPSTPTSYTVKSGDTLFSIAEQFRNGTPLATYVNRIYQLNNLGENSLLSLGDVIKLPTQ
ncbi:MAG: LysM domain-containing protein [Chloroflexi bacterium]|nr:MAG: LysM domain-containing protein [Chloroflexota bacterium]